MFKVINTYLHPVVLEKSTSLVLLPGIVALDSNDLVVPGNDISAVNIVGFTEGALETANKVKVFKGIVKKANDTIDIIDSSYIGQSAYFVNDDTVSYNQNTSRKRAGDIVAVDSDGVYVSV